MMPFTPQATIGDVLDDDPELSTFNQLVRRSGVIKRLDGPDTFTVFAPTNDAFEMLPPGTIGALIENGKKLTEMVSYHVSPGDYPGGSIREFRQLPTLFGDPVTVVAADEGVVVGGAGLEETDIQATNGVVHKISNVMFPGRR